MAAVTQDAALLGCVADVAVKAQASSCSHAVHHVALLEDRQEGKRSEVSLVDRPRSSQRKSGKVV